jgi:hypothetical protein
LPTCAPPPRAPYVWQIVWIKLFLVTRDPALLQPIVLALGFAASSHFGATTADPNLRNAVLEYSLPPRCDPPRRWSSADATGHEEQRPHVGDGILGSAPSRAKACEVSDASPYHVRDLATTFYLQAVALLLDGERALEMSAKADSK